MGGPSLPTKGSENDIIILWQFLLHHSILVTLSTYVCQSWSQTVLWLVIILMTRKKGKKAAAGV